MNSTIIITNHVRERFVERFSIENRKAYAHLQSCDGCPQCISLIFKRKREIDDNRHNLDKTICHRLHTARETRIHHNNLYFMDKMIAKYGDHPAHFLVSDDILFVVIDTPDGKICVTCVDVKTSVLRDFVRRPKFRKKEDQICALQVRNQW